MAFGSKDAQKILSDLGIVTADDEVRLLNGLLALGYDPAKVQGFSDRDPNRRYLGDAVTRALNSGIRPGDIKKAIAFDEVARTERDPVRRVQRLAEVLGVDMRRVTDIANRGGGTPDAWIAAVEEVGRAGRVTGTQTLLGSDAALQTFRSYATFQPATYVGKGEQRPAPGAPTPQVTGPPGSAGYLQQRGAPREEVAAAGVPSGGALTGPGGAGGAGGGGGRGTVTDLPGAMGPVTEPFPSNPNEVKGWLQRNAPEWAYLLDIPEVAVIVRDPNVWKEGSDDADLRSRLMGTQWWQKTEPAARQWLDLKSRDPASANDQIARQVGVLKQQAQSLGITIPEDQWNRLAEDSLKFAWDDNEIRTNLGAFFAFDAAKTTGAAQAAEAHVRQAARDWLVPIDDATIGDWVTRIVRGQATTDYFDTYLANQAESLYPQLADPISRGIPVAKWMNSYKTIAAQTLNLDPETIDLRDPKWLRAISQVDEKGARSAMTLYDWQNLLKTDEIYGWDKTQAGRDHGASLARGIASQFGFASGRGM